MFVGRKGVGMKLLFFVTEDWYFCSHRLPLAIAAKAAGYDVTVITRIREHGEVIQSSGIRIIPFENNRRSLNPFSELAVVLRLARIYKKEKPDIVHNVAVKPVVYGAIAARIARVPRVIHALAGLGWLSSSRSNIAKLLNGVARFFFKRILSQGNIIVQNPDDREWLIGSGILPKRISLIRGSGVDLGQFSPLQKLSVDKTVTVVLVSRMLWDKGIGQFVEAAREIRKSVEDVQFLLVGSPDNANPASISEEQLAAWSDEGVVSWLGRRDDVAEILSTSHIACLPSYYGEGVPKSLLEAASAGLPIVTTDSPGCREVVNHDVNGFLVEPRNITELTNALFKLIRSPGLRVHMGKKSRALAEREFSIEQVVAQTLRLYQKDNT